jgi:hypothetical protein
MSREIRELRLVLPIGNEGEVTPFVEPIWSLILGRFRRANGVDRIRELLTPPPVQPARNVLFVGSRVRLRLALQNQELAASDLAG